MAARMCGLLNPTLRSNKVYASLLNYSTTLEGFSDWCSVEDNKINLEFVKMFCKHD